MSKHSTRQIRDVLDQSGQSVVMIALMILSFLMFFSFTINTGLLINAKISVQAAADAAAYAGAATQARQLNAISYLNYDMRRQFKKFLFRYFYVGGMGNPNFPKRSDLTEVGDYDFPKLDYSGSASGNLLGLKVPVICIPLTMGGSANDNCLMINMRNSAADMAQALGSAASLNPITQTFIDSSLSVSQMQQVLCDGQGKLNLFALMSWLFRGDQESAALESVLSTMLTAAVPAPSDAEKAQMVSALGPLVKGLGLYARNTLSLMRIETLEGFLNEKPQIVTQDDVLAMEKSTTADSKERTILAFKSALSNLNATLFDADRVTLEELHPDKMIETTPVKTDMNVFIQMMESGAPMTLSTGNVTYCNSNVLKFESKGAPIGVRLVPSAGRTVHYAVKVRAFLKPRGLLFAPGAEALELDAVAGAKPFGSRIGPANIVGTDFQKTIQGVPSLSMNGIATPICPNDTCTIPLIEVGAQKTFLSVEFLKELKTRATGGGTVASMTGIVNAQRHAMAPNPSEVGHYSIIPPPPSANQKANMALEFIPYTDFESNPNEANSVYRFYAPLFPGSGGDPAQKIDATLADVFPDTAVGVNALGIAPATLKNTVKGHLLGYIANYLNQGQGENLESTTFAAIELPMANLTAPNSGIPFWLTSERQVLTSWGPDYVRQVPLGGGNPTVTFKPRFGYSVRFVALRDLLTQGLPSSDPDLETVAH